MPIGTPLQRAMLGHFKGEYYATFKVNIMALYREILRHFKGEYCATLKANITPLEMRILRHFTGEYYAIIKVLLLTFNSHVESQLNLEIFP